MEHTNVPARWLLGGAGALAVGSFLPWAQVGPFSKNGTDGDGVLTLVLAVVIAIVAWPTLRTSVGRARTVTTSIAAALALIVCVYDIADVSSSESKLLDAQVGTGLWMATAGAVAVLVGVFLGIRRKVLRFAAASAVAATSVATPEDAEPEGSPRWAPDPTGHHELRYWNGSEWTDHISDGGVPGTDPLADHP